MDPSSSGDIILSLSVVVVSPRSEFLELDVEIPGEVIITFDWTLNLNDLEGEDPLDGGVKTSVLGWICAQSTLIPGLRESLFMT